MARKKTTTIDVDEIIDGVAYDSEDRKNGHYTKDDFGDPPIPASKKTYGSGTSSHYISSTSYKGGSFERCYQTHPALTLKHEDGREAKFFGGACAVPVEGCDIYVALDWNTTHMHGAWPWCKNPQTFIPFHIKDMSIPENADEFIAMVNWLAEQALSGKLVHIGCLGGHGRTGMVLSALTKVITGEAKAIEYVREHYCKKVVETNQQVGFLTKHFGIEHESGGTKESKTRTHTVHNDGGSGWGDLVKANVQTTAPKNFFEQHGYGVTDKVDPVKVAGNIWGSRVVDIRY